MTDTTPTIATTTLAPRIAHAVNPAQVQRLPHGSIIIHDSVMPLGSDVTRLEHEDAPAEPAPAAVEDEVKPRRRKRLAVPADPQPAPIEPAIDAQSLAAEAHRVSAKLAEHLSLGVGARPSEVLAAFEARRVDHDSALVVLATTRLEGHVPEHLTFPQAFALGYKLLDTRPTTEEQEKLVNALVGAFGLWSET